MSPDQPVAEAVLAEIGKTHPELVERAREDVCKPKAEA
jgi:hypothetical protein